MREKVTATVRDAFKPEFLNRVDEIIVFHRLSPEQLARIVVIQLETVQRRLSERNIALEVTDAARRYLADKGYEPAYGARPIKRLIQREIENELALRLLDGTFGDGDVVDVEAGDEGLRFARRERESSERPLETSGVA
jgi:ATP-dependent Clp protease ATP-binding subunit ClpB